MRPSPVTMLTTPGGSSAWRTTSQKRSAVSGVVSAGFSTTVLPQASAGAIFHASISNGKFHGMICPATPSGLWPSIRERVLELVRPARVVEEVRGGEREVDVAGLLDRLAAVQRLEHGELARALLQDARDPEEVLRALGAGELRPAVRERGARGGDGAIDLLLGRLSDRGERFLVARRNRLVRLRRLDPLAADEEAVALSQRDDVTRLRRRCVRPFLRDRGAILFAVELSQG